MMEEMTKEEAREILRILDQTHPDAKTSLDAVNPYQMLIATILSAQTTDVQVNKVTPALFAAYPTPGDLGRAQLADVEDLIHSLGFYRTKAKNIIKTGAKLDQDFAGQVPQTLEELTSLPGVGRKTANVVLSNCFQIPAIAVDTHVFRVSNRLGLSQSKNVEACEKDLQAILDREAWSHAHHLLIFHGRRICKAQNPHCLECPVRDHCRFYVKSRELAEQAGGAASKKGTTPKKAKAPKKAAAKQAVPSSAASKKVASEPAPEQLTVGKKNQGGRS